MILSEEELILSETQIKLISGGWGSEVFNETEVKKIIYESDGIDIEGYFAYPKNVKEKLPLIIWNRGGNRKDGSIDDFLAKGMFGEIASWGYIVLASNYSKEDEFGGKDVNDIMNLILLADEIPNCDSDKIGMEGWSRGGMMTYKVLTRTDRIKCAVIISGLADLFRSEEYRSDLVEVYQKLFGSENEAEFIKRKKERSAVYFAGKINKATDLLLIHGTSDNKISYKDSEDMYDKLNQNGINCELKLIKDGDHYLKKNKAETTKLRRDWFDKYLKSER